jgi:hypothetical protein
MNTEVLKRKKVLYLTVPFFEYTHFIEMEMKNLGADVDTVILYVENHVNALLSRLNKGLFDKKHETYLSSVLKPVLSGSKNYDYVFIQFPHRLGTKYLNLIRERFKSSLFIHYAWDPEYVYNNRIYYPFFDKNITFDKSDATEFGLIYIPLFYTHHFELAYNERLKKNKFQYDIAFIGKVSFYKERYIWIENFTRYCNENGFSYFIFLLTNRRSYLKNLMRGVYLKGIKFRSMNLTKVAEIYQNTKAVIDQRKPNQVGFAMRTFEILGAGCKLITTNDTIKCEPFYDENNINVIKQSSVVINRSFIDSPVRQIDNITNYRIDNWLRQIFE